MYSAEAGVQMKDHDSLLMKLSGDDTQSLKMTGQITDRIYKNGVLVEERVGHNLVVNSVLKLIMCLLKKIGRAHV